MLILINNYLYSFYSDVVSCCDTRESYFHLANVIYGLNFDKWYNSGFWDNKFIPYVLYDKDIAVSSVGVCINDVIWQNSNKCYLQISTVMTLPEYRRKGLNRWLMEYVLKEWDNKCDAIYLLANNSVVDFYPKFGFEEFTEYDFTIPVQKIKGEYRKLNINNKEDLELLIKKYEISNPFAEIKVKNFSLFMSYCLNLHDHIYYLKQYDTVALVKHDGNKMICYDIFTNLNVDINEILGVLADENTEYAYLGFTPKSTEKCSVVKSQEEDNHLFVLSGKVNIFRDNKIMFPLLSRA